MYQKKATESTHKPPRLFLNVSILNLEAIVTKAVKAKIDDPTEEVEPKCPSKPLP